MHAPRTSRPSAVLLTGLTVALAAGLVATTVPAAAAQEGGSPGSSVPADDTPGGKRKAAPAKDDPGQSYKSTRVPKQVQDPAAARDKLKGLFDALATMSGPQPGEADAAEADADEPVQGPSSRRTLDRGKQAVDDLVPEDLDLLMEALEVVPDLDALAATPTATTSPTPDPGTSTSRSSLRQGSSARLTASTQEDSSAAQDSAQEDSAQEDTEPERPTDYTAPDRDCEKGTVPVESLVALRTAAFALDKALIFVPNDLDVLGNTTVTHPAKLIVGGLFTGVDSVLFALEQTDAVQSDREQECLAGQDTQQLQALGVYLDQEFTFVDQSVRTVEQNVVTEIGGAVTTINEVTETTGDTVTLNVNSNTATTVSGAVTNISEFVDAAVTTIDASITTATTTINQNTDEGITSLTELVLEETAEIDAEQAAHDLREQERFAELTEVVTDRFTRVDVNLARLQATLDASVSRDLENYLASCTALVTLYLPASKGGRLDQVKALVGTSIGQADSVGVNVGVARNKFAAGNAAFDAAQYPRAFGDYCQAYRSLTTPAN